MSDVELSPKTRALFDAAKSEGPGSLAKAKIWGGVAATAAAAAGAGGTSGAAAAAAGASGKLIAIGALFGSAVTVGLAVALLRIGPAAPAPSAKAAANSPLVPELASFESTRPSPAASSAFGASDSTAPLATTAPVAAPAASASSSNATASKAHSAAHNIASSKPNDDALVRETMLVAEARGALMRGDARAALAAVRAARTTGSRALEPEELALEARALRTLGRDNDATTVEGALRTKYPEHALAR